MFPKPSESPTKHFCVYFSPIEELAFDKGLYQHAHRYIQRFQSKISRKRFQYDVSVWSMTFWINWTTLSMIFTESAVEVPSNRIQSVTESGIEYLDEKGDLQSINFEECYQRWLQHELSHLEKYDPPFANEEAFRNHFEGWNEVGARYYPIFIQFYSEPQVRFVFNDPDELMKIRMQIWRTGGWQTTDLT